MRKINPADVRTQFEVEVDELLAHFDRVVAALSGSSSEQQDISRLASRSFLSMFVMFERFCSDLFLAYLNRDFSRFQGDLSTRVDSSIREKFGVWVGLRTHFTSVTHVPVDDLELAVDPEGRNLTFKTAEDMVEKADRWLVSRHRNRIRSIDAADERLLDTARTVRNFVAHQSKSSKDRMNGALATITAGTHNAGLNRGAREIHNVGAYLKAFAGATRRLHGYGARLKQVAAKM